MYSINNISMRNKLQLIVRLLCVAVFLWLAPGIMRAETDVWNGTDIASGFADGNGEELNPFQITTAAQLAYLAQQVNLDNDKGGSDYTDKYFKLMNDIDLNNKDWTPIGNDHYFIFKGSFDGQKHIIKNLTIENEGFAGLFGHANGGTIQNLGVIISKQGINSTRSAGGIVGESDNLSVKNCFVTGGPIIVNKGTAFYAGGIIGTSNNTNVTVEYCYVAVDQITSIITRAGNNLGAGGIVGTTATVRHCLSFTGLIQAAIAPGAEGEITLKRIASADDSQITDCYSMPMTFLVDDGETTIPKGNDSTDKNGADITKDKFNGNPGGILEGWANQGWTLHEGQLPTLDQNLEGLPLDQFLITGDGKEMTPYEINSVTALNYYIHQINQGITDYNSTEHFKLTNDITVTSSWTPIGTTDHPFKGTFDGNNHTVTLGIKADAKLAQAGLFGTIDAEATVQKVAVNVVADGITSTANGVASKAGAIAAINKGTIDQCYVTGEGSVLSSNGTDRHAGGIAGDNSGTISNCYNLIPVKVNNSSDVYFGGIAGYNTGTIEYCFASGEVSIATETAVSSLEDGTDATAGGIAGFNDYEHDGVVKNCLAVNAMIPTEAHRLIGTGGDDDDANNFSFYEMPRPLTKAAADYDPLEGTPLTKDNLNSNAGGCFNGWDTSVWDLNSFSTLPKLQGYTAQPEKAIAPYLLYTVTLNTPDNGTLSVTYVDSQSSSATEVNNNDQVPYNTILTITATPANDKYDLEELTVNGSKFDSGSPYTVTDDVTVSATFSPKEVKPDPVPDPDPKPDPEPDPTPVYNTVTLPAVEGAVTDPVAGKYEIESWSNFRFYLTLDKEYDKSEPVVTTDRGETITPRSSDGAYIIKYVRTDLQIFIDGIAKNPSPVANEKIEASHTKVWKTDNYLHIQAITDGQGFIYTAEGKLQKICRLIAGEIETVQLPTGIYLIRIGKESFKVVL